MKKVIINNSEVVVPDNSTVMQACEIAGEEIPRFCFHERLSIAGNCRMCLVEVENSPKPVASCALVVSEGMKIHTDTNKVKKARKGVMEFLLINHPLDCPICDQGGECDLQDQSIYYGKSYSRFEEGKRAVDDKDFGPLIKTVMTRCIHCTRCVRFLDEVAGTHELGAINRGENMEITSVVKGGIKSEMSGNIIDLCPVGALTSKPYAFTARSWELIHHDTIDITDGVGSNIIVDEFGGEVKRILPRINEDINQEWISDKARFCYDGLINQRLDKPFFRNNKAKLQACNWDKALSKFQDYLTVFKKEDIAVIAGALSDVETMYVAKDLFNSYGIYNLDCRFNGSSYDTKSRADYLFNASINGIDQVDKILIIGCDPKREATLVNARIRQRWLTGEMKIATMCTPSNLTYSSTHFGNDISLLNDSNFLKKVNDFFKGSKFPMLILGDSILSSEDGANIHKKVKLLVQELNIVSKAWNGFCVLNSFASRVGGLDIKFLPTKSGLDVQSIKKRLNKKTINLLVLIEADDFDISNYDLADTKIIYIGHHGDKVASKADVILPITAFTEKKSLFVNIEGRPQFTKKIIQNKGVAVDGWKIFRAMADKLNINLEYNDHDQLIKNIFGKHPEISEINSIKPANWSEVKSDIFDIKPSNNNYFLENYYQTCPITRASINMANCKKNLINEEGDF